MLDLLRKCKLILIFFSRSSEEIFKNCISILFTLLTFFITNVKQVKNIIRVSSKTRSSSAFLVNFLWFSPSFLFRFWCWRRWVILIWITLTTFIICWRINPYFPILFENLSRRKFSFRSIQLLQIFVKYILLSLIHISFMWFWFVLTIF